MSTKPTYAVLIALLAIGPAIAKAPAAASAANTAAKTTSAPVPTPTWVAASNAYTQKLILAQAPFNPEQLSYFGVPGYDDQVFDFGPDYAKRFRQATERARDVLKADATSERDPNVQQDLAILIRAADDAIESSEVNERLTRPWLDVGQTVFGGLQGLLSEQTPAERRPSALDRLRRYVGQTPGSTALVELARQRYIERSDAALVQPTQIEVQQSLENLSTYKAGIRDLFTKYEVKGAESTLAALDTQLDAYGKWTREVVLPTARTTYVLPAELYALSLKGVGIDLDPNLLIERAQVGFMETRAAMQQLAPRVAAEKKLKATDYMAVLRALKRPQLANDQIESHYRKVVMPTLDRLIAEHDVVALPKRPMQMRLGTPAESAAQPAPHFQPAPLVGNTGQQGTFVLPLGNPAAGKDAQYDDFNFPAVAWTLTAHEGRPGHELQFSTMVERGISLARTLYAFNSVNVEGWALYAEAEMVPYEPIEGQFFALQFRLLRAARAMLDPMLNLGLTDRDTAKRLLMEQVGLSNAMATQEIDRYTVKAPGQAGSYFYGYSRILQLRAETEIALGSRFNRRRFNDFLLAQGLLPPALLAKAVREVFVPSQR